MSQITDPAAEAFLAGTNRQIAVPYFDISSLLAQYLNDPVGAQLFNNRTSSVVIEGRPDLKLVYIGFIGCMMATTGAILFRDDDLKTFASVLKHAWDHGLIELGYLGATGYQLGSTARIGAILLTTYSARPIDDYGSPEGSNIPTPGLPHLPLALWFRKEGQLPSVYL
jgi:hypothetical protein